MSGVAHRAVAGGDPLVSVIVPVFNAQATLESTLASVARQTYREIEIIIVDDGSTDASPAIAERFCAEEPHARLLRQKRSGAASARNLALEEATGEFVAPIDADDLWHPAKVERQMEAALGTLPAPALIYCFSRMIDEAGRVIGSMEPLAMDGLALFRFAWRNPVGNGSAPLVRRDALRAAGGYDERLRSCEDMLLHLNIVSRSPVAVVPEYLVGYRVRPKGKSGDPDRMVEAMEQAWSLFDIDCAPAIGEAIRWNRARSFLAFAERKACLGNYPGCARLLAAALLLDPPRSGTVLAYRLARTIGRRLFPGRPMADAPAFERCDPAAAMRHDPHEIPLARAAIAWIDRRRLERLSRRDRAHVEAAAAAYRVAPGALPPVSGRSGPAAPPASSPAETIAQPGSPVAIDGSERPALAGAATGSGSNSSDQPCGR